MYQLYCARNTYAMGVHVLLEELQVAYEVTLVTLFSTTYPKQFLEASPHARVPALQHQHGTVFESGAITEYLAEMHVDKGFSVAVGSPWRAQYLQWMYYLASTVQPEVMIQFHPEFYFPDSATQQKLKAASLSRLVKSWEILNTAYAKGPWLIDGRPTPVDYCLAIQLEWPQCFVGTIQDFPNLQRMLEKMSTRSAYQKIMQWHRQPV